MHSFRKYLVLFLLAVFPATGAFAQVVAPSSSRIVNFSARAYSGAGENILISGFAINGQHARPLLIRAVGPGLSRFGITNFMPDPELLVFRTSTQQMVNDNWWVDPDLAGTNKRLGAFALESNSRDAAVLLPLAPGTYTAHARGLNGALGEVLFEVYDAADVGDPSRSMANASLRGRIGPSTPLIIVGFVISGPDPKPVLIRAIGPTLARFGLGGALGNPRMRVFSGGTVIAENDDWSALGANVTEVEAAFTTSGAFALPRGSRDAALALTLPPGPYTVHVDNPTGGVGVVLTEIYDLAPPEPGTILPNPDPGSGALPTVSIHANRDRIREGVTPGTSMLVVRSGDVAAPLRVYLARSGTATPADIPGVPSSVLIPAGASTASVPISAWSDNTWEPSELLTVSVQTNAAYLVSGLGRAHVIIEDVTQSAGTGWTAEYFNSRDLTGGAVVTRTDATIDFDWGADSPDPAVDANNFSARWTGYLEVPTNGTYTFITRTDDGNRLWVDDQLVIDAWFDQSARDRSGSIALTAGRRYSVRLEYYDRSGNAVAALYWQTAGGDRALIPSNSVYQVETSAPQIISDVEALALVGGPFNYQIAAVGGPTSYGVADLPAGLAFNPTTGTISGTPSQAGEYVIVLRATNARGTGAELLRLKVLSAGAAPVAERWTAAASGLEVPATAPSSTAELTAFESGAPAGTAIERVRGFFLAPETGTYQFGLAASGPARLLIADSDQVADRWPRASVASSSGARAWTATPEQLGLPISLTAGQRYYFEVTHRPAAGGGHLSLGWRRPSVAADGPLELVPVYVMSQYVDHSTGSDGRTLYLANLRPLSGVISPASGLASLLLDEEARMASITLRMTGLSSAQISAYMLAGPEGGTGPLIQALPNGQFNNFTWQIRDTGNLTADDLLDALRDGLLSVVIYSTNYPEGELRGHFGPSAGSSEFQPPAPPPAFSLNAPTPADAARFLTQATFGPTEQEINRVVQQGYANWLDQQFNRSATEHAEYLEALEAEFALRDPPERINQGHRQEAWWNRVLKSDDQLRQRVAFALSETLVVSDVGGLNGQPMGLAVYYDILVRNAFGNFHDLIEEVTLSPAMGNYLSMLRNQKGDPVRGTLPDENYAREIMQLFTIGLNRLHPDGTLVLDSHGVPIPTYSQETIMGLARVFTGWSYHAEAGEGNFRYGDRDFLRPMMLYSEYHENGDKLLVESSVLRGGQAGDVEMDFVLDMLFNHPNTGPFIAHQLIQRLVTSNPSPGYVYRVAQVFADNGAGVRGDLRAVVRAILLDYEARSPAVIGAMGYGKLREPLLRLTHLWRAFDAKAEGGFPYSYRNPERDFMQAALRAPTVFNFFEPAHVHPGLLASAGLVAPEFQISNEQSIVSTSNALRRAVFRGLGSSEWPVLIDVDDLTGLAANHNALVDELNLLLMNGQMSAEMRNTLLQTCTLLDVGRADATEKVRSIINLILISPEYAVQK